MEDVGRLVLWITLVVVVMARLGGGSRRESSKGWLGRKRMAEACAVANEVVGLKRNRDIITKYDDAVLDYEGRERQKLCVVCERQRKRGREMLG